MTDLLGVYEHYKGKKYEVIALATHSETLEDLVAYKALYDNDLSEYWVRPVKMFTELVEVNGERVPRFKKLN